MYRLSLCRSITDCFGNNILHKCIQSKNLSLTKYLLKYTDINVNNINSYKNTSLQCLEYSNSYLDIYPILMHVILNYLLHMPKIALIM